MLKTLDPVTMEVIYHRLTSIADEMEMTLLKSSYSAVVKEARDCSTAIFDAAGLTVAQALAQPIHLGIMMMSVPQILRVFPKDEMCEGDIYLANDPYSGGTHLPDITMVVPVFHEGEVVALSCSIVHHQDIGAITPGVPTAATSLYHEGLNLPPLKLYEEGRPVRAVHDIIRNNVRGPETVLGDLRAQIAAGNVGRQRILELIAEYGKEAMLGAIAELMDYSERLTRQKLAEIPDGTYHFVDYMDNDGVVFDQRIKLEVKVTIRGSEFHADFTGTSPEVRGPFNCVPASVLPVICYAVRAISDPRIPNNAGCFRPVSYFLPEGSIVNPRHPAACGARTATSVALTDTMIGALVQAIPDRLPAANGVGNMLYFGGKDPITRRDYIVPEFGRGGTGARPGKDGVDTISTDLINGWVVPTEAFSAGTPIRVVRHVLWQDSGGAGEFRGGLGQEKVFELTRGTASVTYRGERHYTQPWGLFGGLPGPCCRGFVRRKSGREEEILSKGDIMLEAGDQVHVFMSGGGGYGDPLKRPPELVRQDVLDRKVSPISARDNYAVVLRDPKFEIDWDATDVLRKEQSLARGPITWTYDGVFGKE